MPFQEVNPDDLLVEISRERKYFRNRGGVIFQGRYVIRQPARESWFFAKRRYFDPFKPQWNKNLAELTSWDIEEIQQKAESDRKAKIANLFSGKIE